MSALTQRPASALTFRFRADLIFSSGIATERPRKTDLSSAGANFYATGRRRLSSSPQQQRKCPAVSRVRASGRCWHNACSVSEQSQKRSQNRRNHNEATNDDQTSPGSLVVSADCAAVRSGAVFRPSPARLLRACRDSVAARTNDAPRQINAERQRKEEPDGKEYTHPSVRS